MIRAIAEFADKIRIAGQLLQFLWERKLWWLLPMVVMLLLLGLLLVLAQSTAVAPFVYPIF